MKRFFLTLLALTLLVSAALADPLPLGEGLSGVAVWPEGADESAATYVYRYAYPTVAGDDEVSGMINDFYTYLVDDALAFAFPMTAEELEGSDVQAYTTITGEVTCNNDDYLSVRVTTESFRGAAVSVVAAGHVFARHGDKAGSAVSLPYMLGILRADETDQWMQDRQTAKADDMVRRLVWEVIQEQLAAGEVAYYDDLTYETLENVFYPEEDFFLDENGDPVFFLQEAMVAPQTEGILYFPFTLEELLDEI